MINPRPPHDALDFSSAKTYPLETRKSKVDVGNLPDPTLYQPGKGSIESLIPRILKGEDIQSLADSWVSAVQRGRTVILGMGAHPIKVGLSRLLICLLYTSDAADE